jgi:chromate reductase
MKKKTIGVFAGSLRKESYCKKISRAIAGFMPDRFEMKMVELGRLCMFNQDFDDENRVPLEWASFRREVEALEGCLFVTPEYNRSMPVLLKNALDIASRPFGQNRWSGKPGAVAGGSPGKLGAVCGVQALKQTLSFLNIYLMPQPELYLAEAALLINEEGEISAESTRRFLEDFADAFAAWVDRF